MSELIEITVAIEPYHLEILEIYAAVRGQSRAATANQLLQSRLEQLAPTVINTGAVNDLIIIQQFIDLLTKDLYKNKQEEIVAEAANVLEITVEDVEKIIKTFKNEL